MQVCHRSLFAPHSPSFAPSTSLWETLPAEAMDIAVYQHHACIRQLAIAHGGYESHTEVRVTPSQGSFTKPDNPLCPSPLGRATPSSWLSRPRQMRWTFALHCSKRCSTCRGRRSCSRTNSAGLVKKGQLLRGLEGQFFLLSCRFLRYSPLNPSAQANLDEARQPLQA